ncbi:MAG TPA: hypothetical protein VJ850_08025 [Candidatus Limnocylindrales bacterium]|nr:hypothetical protein [Candidatus Limnocylindrales bacterium]
MQVGDRLDPADLVGQRWFAAPPRPITAITVEERFDFPGGGALLILRVDVDGGRSLWRSMPIESADGRSPWVELLELAMRGGWIHTGDRASLHAYRPTRPSTPSGLTVAPLGKDQSHTSVVVDDSTVLKLYRALTRTPNPEVELGRALADDPDAPVPTYRGAVTVSLSAARLRWSESFALAFAQEYVPDAGDAFEDLAERLAAWLRAGAPNRAVPSLIVDAVPAARATTRLHSALFRKFKPALNRRWVRPTDTGQWRRRAARAHRTAVRVLRSADPERAGWLVERRDVIEDALAPLVESAANWPPPGLQRIHGDLHLGQLLRDGYQFLISDLEGEPQRPVAERRRLDTPLRDVASMLRSIDHVARSGMRRAGMPIPELVAGTSAADPAIEAWLGAMRAKFLEAYAAEAAARNLRVDIDARLLHALEVEKELYEFSYAATYLPAWMYAPSAGMRWLLDR